jgi:hypothetical protein
MSEFGSFMRKAKIIAKRFDTTQSFEEVRDHIDLLSGGDLDCWQLDKVTDEVMKHAKEPRFGDQTPSRG